MITSLDLISLLRNAGYKPYPYSGRGMFGHECIAISSNDITVWDIAQVLADVSLPVPRTDSLGNGVVIYWPKLEWPESEREYSKDLEAAD